MSMAYAIEREKPDAVLHLGDHTDDVDDIRRAFPALTIYHVRDNNDFDMDVPLFAVVTVGGVRMYLTHGHRERVSMLHSGLVPARAREEGCSFAFFGHTHRMMAEREQGVFVCNPGSISLPRGGPASYARLDIEGGMVRTLELVDEDGALLVYFSQTVRDAGETLHVAWPCSAAVADADGLHWAKPQTGMLEFDVPRVQSQSFAMQTSVGWSE